MHACWFRGCDDALFLVVVLYPLDASPFVPEWRFPIRLLASPSFSLHALRLLPGVALNRGEIASSSSGGWL